MQHHTLSRRTLLQILGGAAVTSLCAPAHASIAAPGKVSIYGDSVTASKGYAALFVARTSGRIPAVNDYSRGSNSFEGNLAGTHPDGPLFNGLTFAQHVTQVDDADICFIRLGSNSDPAGWVKGDSQAAVGADFLAIASQCLQHVQYARAAGKRVVLVGTPYTSIQSLMAYFGIPEAFASVEAERIRNVNTAIRCVAGILGVPFIATHGFGGAGGHPIPVAADVPDGIHPTPDYAERVGNYMADQIVALFGL